MTKASNNYERLVRELHEALFKADGVENILVLHDVKISGKSGASHQIDVYWEFKLAGVMYKTCIECKHWNSTVKKSHVASFSTVIDDIGNVTGIFATTVDFQRGARLLAKYKGIRLILVNYLLKEINLNMKFRIPETHIVDLEFDRKHAKTLLAEKGMDSFEFKLNLTGFEVLYDLDGNKKCLLRDLFNVLKNNQGDNRLELIDTYFKTEIGNIRLNAILYRTSYGQIETNDLITINDISKAIMEDIFENTACYLNDDGSVTDIET